MKKLLSISAILLALLPAATATAAERSVTLLLTAGSGDDIFDVKLSHDGRSYQIDSVSPLEAGGGICTHEEGSPHALSCEAAAIGGIEVNAAAGDDSVIISPRILIPATIRGGSGNDRLRAGGGPDKIIGGPGHDVLIGEGGSDWLYGGPGDDWLLGGPGEDRLVGGPGPDWLNGGSGEDTEKVGPGDTTGPKPPA
jgi:Ca2+-binding RTX toxin-like protein